MDVVETLYHLIVVLHLLGMAGVVGGWLATVRTPKIVPAMLHGSLTALVTGLILVGLAETLVEDEGPVNHAKIGVKLTIALVVAVLAVVLRKRESISRGLLSAVGGLAVLNVAIAVLW